jgi:glyoxylase-like metal-dependent hydrolase (beta-lactamase superfamily II)
MPQLDPHPTPVDVELVGDETIAFGPTRFEVLATPGHTPGSVCYLLKQEGLRILFTGDVVQNLSRPGGGNLGTYAAHLAPLFGGDARAYLASLRRLRALPLPDLVLPGHPRMDPSPQSPRLTTQSWHALLDTGIAELEQLLARYEADGAKFLDGTPRQLLPGLHYLGNVGSAAVYCLSTPKGLFLFDAPAGPALVDFLTQCFQKHRWQQRRLAAVLLTSADAEATAGLAALVRHTGCRVVVSGEGVKAVRHLCPDGTEVLSEEGLEKSGWFELDTVPLGGRGRAPLAYRLRWGGKTVLLSGRIPVKPSGPSLEQLHREVTGLGGSPAEYTKSLDRLAKVNPDLWLPAVPVHGQNANLYDRDWEEILERNRQLFRW